MEKQSKIYLASDHAAWELKDFIKKSLPDLNWFDLGTRDGDSRVNYAVFAKAIALEIQENGGRGILLCGSGQGVAMVANKYKGIRAALCWSPEVAKLAREHNDSNILCLPGRFLSPDQILEIVSIWLLTGFEGGRHADRLASFQELGENFKLGD